MGRRGCMRSWDPGAGFGGVGVRCHLSAWGAKMSADVQCLALAPPPRRLHRRAPAHARAHPQPRRPAYDTLITELGIRSVIAGDSHKAAQRQAAAPKK